MHPTNGRLVHPCKCLEFWESEKLNIIYLKRARKSLSFFVEKLKKGEKMSDNPELMRYI